MGDNSIHPDVRIGHVHLKVTDLERALSFYCGVLSFIGIMLYVASAPGQLIGLPTLR